MKSSVTKEQKQDNQNQNEKDFVFSFEFGPTQCTRTLWTLVSPSEKQVSTTDSAYFTGLLQQSDMT